MQVGFIYVNKLVSMLVQEFGSKASSKKEKQEAISMLVEEFEVRKTAEHLYVE